MLLEERDHVLFVVVLGPHAGILDEQVGREVAIGGKGDGDEGPHAVAFALLERAVGLRAVGDDALVRADGVRARNGMVAAVLLGAEQLHACAQQRGGVVHFQLAAVPLLLGEQRLALAVVDRVVAGEVVAPHLSGHAAERRGGQHVDLADVRIGGLGLVVRDDAVDQLVVGLLHRACRNLQHGHVAVAVGAGHAVSVAVVVVRTDGRLVDMRRAHGCMVVCLASDSAVASLLNVLHGWNSFRMRTISAPIVGPLVRVEFRRGVSMASRALPDDAPSRR